MISVMCLVVGFAHQGADEALVRATILDYVEGYYSADAARVERALSPALAKRALGRTKDGKPKLLEETAEAFIKLSKSGDGPRSYPIRDQRKEVTIFEITPKLASAKLIGADWIDFIHLVKQDGRWQIINVLWSSYPPVNSKKQASQ